MARMKSASQHAVHGLVRDLTVAGGAAAAYDLRGTRSLGLANALVARLDVRPKGIEKVHAFLLALFELVLRVVDLSKKGLRFGIKVLGNPALFLFDPLQAAAPLFDHLHGAQDLLLDGGDLGRHPFDLVEERGVLVVGLHLRGLTLELRALGFGGLELPFVGALRLLCLFDLLLLLVDQVSGGLRLWRANESANGSRGNAMKISSRLLRTRSHPISESTAARSWAASR